MNHRIYYMKFHRNQLKTKYYILYKRQDGLACFMCNKTPILDVADEFLMCMQQFRSNVLK